MVPNKKYNYWKKAWHSWTVFAAILLQVVGIILKLKDLRVSSRPEIRDKLFSPEAWELYLMNPYFQYAISVLLIGLFLGILSIGWFARSKEKADRWEIILFIVIALFWGIVSLLIPVFSDKTLMLSWGVIMLTIIGGSAYAIRKNRSQYP